MMPFKDALFVELIEGAGGVAYLTAQLRDFIVQERIGSPLYGLLSPSGELISGLIRGDNFYVAADLVFDTKRTARLHNNYKAGKFPTSPPAFG